MAVRICSIHSVVPVFVLWSLPYYGSGVGPVSMSFRRTNWFSERQTFLGHYARKFEEYARIFGCFLTYHGIDLAFLNLFCELSYGSI